MKVIIMGCGRVGAQMATMLDQEGHSVIALDTDAYSFRRLPPDFKGEALLGDGLDEDVLRRAGIEDAEAFVAVTQEDNRNVMAAQIAQKIFNVKKVVCRIYDPMRRDLYSVLGLEAISPTIVLAEMLKEKLES